jgi:hypothetical protein
MPVLTFVNVTSTPGMSAPEESAAVPPTAAFWANAVTGRSNASAANKILFLIDRPRNQTTP